MVGKPWEIRVSQKVEDVSMGKSSKKMDGNSCFSPAAPVGKRFANHTL